MFRMFYKNDLSFFLISALLCCSNPYMEYEFVSSNAQTQISQSSFARFFYTILHLYTLEPCAATVSENISFFTPIFYGAYEKLAEGGRKGYATKPKLVENLPFPMSKEGQADFMKKLFSVMEQVPENKCRGFFYWEPAWIPVPGSGWANEAALSYIEEKGPGGTEWANQALFDYDGQALPALEVIRDYVPGRDDGKTKSNLPESK